MEARSHGTLSIVFPYAAIYRITAAGYLTESEKKTAPDGRLRQYYAITPAGRAHLQEMPGHLPPVFSKVSMTSFQGRRTHEQPRPSPV